MVEELTLTPVDYEVYAAIPAEWWDENVVGQGIADAQGRKSGEVLRRIARFVRVGIVERRQVHATAPKTEIRKVGR